MSIQVVCKSINVPLPPHFFYKGNLVSNSYDFYLGDLSLGLKMVLETTNASPLMIPLGFIPVGARFFARTL